MYELTVEMSFSAAHRIAGHKGRCADLHGHNYRAIITVAGERLNGQGMLIDFGDLKTICVDAIDPLDHSYLNDLPAFAEVNPTAEAIAEHIYDAVETALSKAFESVHLSHVTVCESETSYATYRGEASCPQSCS